MTRHVWVGFSWLPHDMSYCDACGRSNKTNNKALCAKYLENQANSIRVTCAATKMAKAPMELEERVVDLEAKRDAMKWRHEEQPRCGRYDDGEEERRSRLQKYGTVGTADMAALSSEEAEPRHSDYGCSRLRRRSRTQHHCQTSSGSGSRSTRAQRRCSKWSIKCYTVSGKVDRKLNCYELITASIRWCLDIEGLTVKDLWTFLEHINFLSSGARNDDFKDSAHYNTLPRGSLRYVH